MRELIILIMACGLAGCTPLSSFDPSLVGETPLHVARISETTRITLPRPPDYPQTRNLLQTIRVQYADKRAAFEAALSLSRDVVEIVVTAPSGPRLATITWTSTGIKEDRTLLAPEGIPVENILADVFILLWPRAALIAALPSDAEVRDGADGSRTVSRAGTPIVEIKPDPGDRTRRTLRNLVLHYELTIVDAAPQ